MNLSKDEKIKNLDVVFSPSTFRDMILFSARFANKSIPEHEWKEVYGFLVGKIKRNNRENKKYLYVAKLIPMIHGTRTEVYFTEQDYALSEKLLDKILELKMFICGWFHTHPGLGLFLSETDIFNQLGFQSAFKDAIAAVYDFTKSDKNNLGLKVYRLDNPDLGIASTYSEIPFEIEDKKDEKPLIFTRSLIDISKSVQEGEPLIKEAREVYVETGKLDNLFNDLIIGKSTQIDNTTSIPTQLDHKIKINEEKLELKAEDNLDLGTDYKIDEDEKLYYEFLDSYSEKDYKIKTLKKKLEYQREQGNYALDTLLKLASRYLEISESDKALQYLIEAESEASSFKNEKDLAMIKNEIGLIYEERADFYNALNYIESANKILEKLGEKKLQVHILNNIAEIYYKMNDIDSAFNYYKEAYDLAKSINYNLGCYITKLNSVEVFLYLKNYGLSYKILSECFQYFKNIQNYYAISVIESLFGKLYFEQGPNFYHLAEDYFTSSIDLKNKLNFQKETIEDWIYLFKIYFAKKVTKKAENYLSEALNIVRTYELKRFEPDIYVLYGDLKYFENKIDEAIEYYNLAIEEYEKLGEDEEYAKICETIAYIYKESKINLDKALEYLYRSLEKYRNLQYSKMIAEILMKIADIYIVLNDPENARNCLIEAQSIYRQIYDEYSVNLIDKKISSLK